MSYVGNLLSYKKRNISLFATPFTIFHVIMELENEMLHKVSQRKSKRHMISLVWRIGGEKIEQREERERACEREANQEQVS